MSAILIGLLCFIFVIWSVGSLAALFLFLLEKASQFFLAHDHLILLLPLLGLATGLSYWLVGKKFPSTKRILLDVGGEAKSVRPFLAALFIFTFTILSQLFGASTGRESTAVQFGASVGDFWRDLFDRKLKPIRFSRQAYIRSGLAAGFGSVFGVPWAGFLFAMEVTPNRRWPLKYLPVCWLSSFGANWVAIEWGAHHKTYPIFPAIPWDALLLAKWTCFGIAFGLLAKAFVWSMQALEKVLLRIPISWVRPVLGGIFVATLTMWFKDTRYNGLGTQLIDMAFTQGIQDFDFLWKGIFTILSSGSGLKGGEVTPMMAMGASFGIVVSTYLALPTLYGASLGLISVFAAASHIPWTGAVMAWEFFGGEAFLPTFIVCWLARKVLGLQGLFVERH
ncbi:chloride channel protein [Bdellovibrio sp. HCB337]|uniref:chloride channel protein n=1 Tax=Bdellovibrio sp. HCB337 TaxID=3394358 RepID=UPI0039A41240